MVTLRIYLGELDSDYIDVGITIEQWRKLLKEKRANIDDGGTKFVELLLTYPREE